MNELSLMEKFADPVLFEGLSKAEVVQGSLITTMMGMGITFSVLTLLWVMIAVMTRAINFSEKKGSTPKVAPAAANLAAATTITAPAVTVAAETGAELIAVITAAIAAMEENTNVKGLIIRKISRVSGNSTSWSRAGSAECLDSRKI